ncbi:GNAT family N-acetyltransferase [Gracilibacillus sp. S3-1-1]|uniref:GNAT family N-acetyltransferase n=1 Tax=Gracilibacillus pellucidus TaxID=3095368 RepID=A0ACC6M6Z6_9BACI|nr:GNAT family N-acetyltransferase [Gracilibacillus sp. S3-1-1]MDX8046673.1 GNAT family N-acetyltransferase [Gracilibacillus sp. S3-1-1]
MNLETNRLLFRHYTDQDFPFLLSLLTNPDVVRFIGRGKPRNEQEGIDFLQWIYDTYRVAEYIGLMVVIDKERNIPIGHAGLVPQTINGRKEIEVGYWIARKYWGNGYATEAATALVEFVRERFRYNKLIALIQPGNTASIQVAKNAGMYFGEKVNLNGQEVHIYQILQSEKRGTK